MTQFIFQTLPAPEVSTYFSFSWQLSLDQAIAAISLYQNFSLFSSIVKELGLELNLSRGKAQGELQAQLLGSYYGNPDNFDGLLDPFLNTMVRLLRPSCNPVS